jgi:AraC-like DNA-binding protein
MNKDTSLSLYHSSAEDCAPGHYYGPAVRDHFLIHYVLKGKGIFKVGETTYHLRAGNGFLICPWRVTFYQADYEEPWSYCWVGFNGAMAEYYLNQVNLTADNPIFDYTKDDYIKDVIYDIIDSGKSTLSMVAREIKQTGLLYLFLAGIMENTSNSSINIDIDNRTDMYVKKAIEFISRNYSRKIRIDEVAGYIGLDRSYLGAIFKENIGCSLKQYLTKYRIDKACGLMSEPELTIGDIARSVGYDDPLLFSKIFKSVKGQSPKAFKKRMA